MKFAALYFALSLAAGCAQNIKVQVDGKKVLASDIQFAKRQGATEKEIHDTVLITAAFCMYNRYVDGLATWAPDDPKVYEAIGKQRAGEGYMTKPFMVKKETSQ